MELRTATDTDLPALRSMMARAIAELQTGLSPEQVAASATMMGLDTQLISDGSYVVVIVKDQIVAGGAWSARATSYGGDHSPGRDARSLDPATEPARIRAMYTDPDHVRRGYGRAVLAECERRAHAAGFSATSLVGTLAGEPLYRAAGYSVVERFEDSNGAVPVPMARMTKQLGGEGGHAR